ncbi:neutral alpha-glucosidase AB-like [Brevipalpus obovatus]|uniref:neutral alpha-glucosidase AB-like n=1 Tax=Brevipalpus obovatus TaxID=246614 RepID=UPI003D9F038F
MIPMKIYLFGLIVISTISFISCVDKSKWKTCNESGFCRRNRNIKGKPNKWIVEKDSIKPHYNKLGVEAILKNELTGVLLRLELNSALQDGSVLHMRINEAHPGRERFDPREALVGEIEYTKLTIDKKSDKDVTIKFGPSEAQYTALVNLNPFRIDIFSGDKLVISANAREFLKFEHYRKKPVKEETNDLDQDLKTEEDEDGGWEESWGSFTDSKPFGPMSVGMDFSFVGFDHVYGIPEHADSFALRDTRGSTDPYRLYNVDIFEYEVNTPMALYGAVPTMIAHSEERTVGLLWLNPSDTFIDIESVNQGVMGLFSNLVSGDVKTRLTHWISETGMIDAYIMMGPKPSDVMRQNAKLTGVTPLPPFYSIGYHQSRWNYFSQDEVSNIDAKFDDEDLPLDAIWLDIEYTEDRSKRYFTWDRNFNDAKTLTSNLTSKGRRLITIIDPHMKKDSSYPVHNEALQNGYYIKNKDNADYEGWCWPGASMWPDYLNPTVRDWWASKFNPEFFPGFPDGVVDIWNDMNEPSVFNGPEVTAPRDLKHFGGVEHRDIHNMYGFYMVQATFKGLTTYRPNLRPFILTRSFFAGSQRYGGAVWTGDNMSKWEHLKISIPMILSLSVVGISFSGADVPGFFYNPESNELVIRWYQAGAFQPFFRGHTHIDTRHREPYVYDDETKSLIRNAIRERYRYMPYIYTLFYENQLSGMPIMRPLWFHFPKDKNTFELEEEYLLGDSLLVRPVLDKDASTVQVYLPGQGESWLNVEDGNIYKGSSTVTIPVTLSSIPRFQRSGTIIPKRERVRRSATICIQDPITLNVFLDGEERRASGKLYLDDGYSYNYKNGGYILAEINYDKMILEYKIIHGSLATKSWLERVVIHHISNKPNRIEASNGANLAFKYSSETKTLTIRKPALSMGNNWQIKLS